MGSGWRSISGTVALVVSALLVGAATALAQTEWSDPHQRFGNWTGDLVLGKNDESVAARAYRARHQLFALSTDQALYFYLRHDAQGRALRGECAYLLSGREPPGRWWSLTAYGVDGFLMQEAGRRFSVAAATRPDAPAPLSVAVGPKRNAGPKPDIVTVPGKAEYLILRIYTPQSLAASEWSGRLPSVRSAGCLPS